MREQHENKFVWAIAGVGLFIIFSLSCFNDGLTGAGDYVFLINRLQQIRDCFENGLYPFLYYEDAGGIGYGSPIFYGQLTLFPFLPLADDSSAFLRAYLLCCLVLNFCGFRCFLKRISSYATLGTCFYIFSMPFVGIFACNLPAFALAVGFSWFFFAYCIDFFRDGQSFYLLILTYFMIWQSNFNTTVLSTLVCFGIFCVYFKRERVLDYVKLLIFVFVLILYNLVNIVVHKDAIAPMSADVMLSTIVWGSDYRVMSNAPIGSHLLRLSVDWADCHTGFLNFGAFGVFLYYVTHYIKTQSKRFLVCSGIIGVALVVGYAVGMPQVWPEFYRATNLFFQFPIRYYIILFGFTLAVLARVIRPNRWVYAILVFCILDIAIVNPFKSEVSTRIEYVGLQLANSEYASADFIRDYDTYLEYCDSVHSERGYSYDFERSYNEVRVDCSSNVSGDVLTLPKLYYNGYRATGSDGETFTVRGGYSNYCEVDIGDYQGVLTLLYQVPGVVLFFFYIQLMCIASILYRITKLYIVPKIRMLRK